MPITIRPVEERDAEAVARIYNEGIADRIATFETEPRSAEDRLNVIRESRGKYAFVVAELDGRVVGWASTSQYRTRPCYRGVAEFSIYVGREARGHGIGQPLLQGLVDQAEAMGFWKLLSRIFPENTASRALCQRVGFREVGVYEKHGKLDGVWKDTVIVERLLPANLT
jgi:L-amino acid N-acyltransferase YncA